MTRPPYRTITVAIVAILALTGGLAIAGALQAAAAVYPAFAAGIGTCVGAVALKAWGEHKAVESAAAEAKP